jgi:precorrin-6B methylase 2
LTYNQKELLLLQTKNEYFTIIKHHLMIKGFIKSLKNYKILSCQFGQFHSMRKNESIDKQGEPIPWYTYPSIEYIKQLDFSKKSVFEFGSGNSTRFWAKRCKDIVAVEDDQNWFEKIKKLLPSNANYLFCATEEEYSKSISTFEHDFDVIIIDGNYRYECAIEALKKLKEDGFIILDNSDWKEKTSELLRNADLIEVDMAGFGPLNGYTWTTSFYFKRGVKLSPKEAQMPLHSIGSLPNTEL